MIQVYSPELADLKILETYDYYDEPVLFSARNSRGQTYLGLLVENSSSRKTWLYSPLSNQRYFEVRSGQIDLRDSFRNVEGGYVFKCSLERADGGRSCEWMSTDLLTDDQLPLEGEKIEFAADRDILRMAFGFIDGGEHQAPVGALGHILGSIQETVNAIGQSMIGTPTERGPVPANILDKVQLVLTETFAASFGVELQPAESPDLFGQTSVSGVILEFFSLLEDSDEPQKLIYRANRLQRRTAKKYRELLSHLSHKVAYVDATLASPAIEGRRAVRLLRSHFEGALGALRETLDDPEPIQFTIEGTLIGCNLRTKTFEVFDIHESTAYLGKIEDDAIPDGAHIVVGELYIAKLQQIEKLTPTGDISVQTRLLELSRATRSILAPSSTNS